MMRNGRLFLVPALVWIACLQARDVQAQMASASTPDGTAMDERSHKDADKAARKRAEFVRDSMGQVRKDREKLGPAELTVAPLPRQERVTLWVEEFTYGGTRRAGTPVEIGIVTGAGGQSTEAAGLSRGLTAQFKAGIVDGESFRVLEQLPSMSAPPKARFIVRGAITELSQESKSGGLGGLVGGKLGGLGKKNSKTIVGVTISVVDGETGEVLFSERGLGVSGKGGGLIVGGAGGGAGAVAGTASDAETAAVSEAIQEAARDAAIRLCNRRDELMVLSRGEPVQQ